MTDTDVAAAEELVKKAEFSLYRIQKGVLHNKVDPEAYSLDGQSQTEGKSSRF